MKIIDYNSIFILTLFYDCSILKLTMGKSLSAGE